MSAIVYQAIVRANGSFLILARIKSSNSARVLSTAVAADISTITRTTTSLRTGATIQAATSLTVADVMTAALSTAGGWTKDTTGWNFHDLAPATLVTSSPGSRLVYTFTLANGVVCFLDVDAKANTSPP